MADRATMKIGGRYNWRSQPERLVYIGRNWSGNGYWHQFEKVGEPGRVWCEALDSDLPRIEETHCSDCNQPMADHIAGCPTYPPLGMPGLTCPAAAAGAARFRGGMSHG